MTLERRQRMLLSQLPGRPIFGVKIWRSWTEEGSPEPEAFEECIIIVRCDSPAEASDIALKTSIQRDHSFVNQLGRQVQVSTLGVDTVFVPYVSRAATGTELFAQVYQKGEEFGPPPEFMVDDD